MKDNILLRWSSGIPGMLRSDCQVGPGAVPALGLHRPAVQVFLQQGAPAERDAGMRPLISRITIFLSSIPEPRHHNED